MSSDELKTMLERGVLYDRFVVPDVQRVYQDSVTGRSSGQLVMRAERIVPPQQLRLLWWCPEVRRHHGLGSDSGRRARIGA